MKNLIKNTLAIIALSLLVSACQKDLEVGGTATQPMSGDWWVVMKATDGNGNVLADYGYSELSTFNTSSNTIDSMWVSDKNTFWQYQVKVAINIEDLTFSIDQGKDLVWDDNTTITNGKIITGGATTPSGMKTDSIYFEVEWASDPGTIYVGSGYRYTGWPDDDH